VGYSPTYASGDWKADCDACGKTFKASDLQKRWDNLVVCPEDFEIRQPQDFVRGATDKIAVPWSRTESTDLFQSDAPSVVAFTATSGVGTSASPFRVTPSSTVLYPATTDTLTFITVTPASGNTPIGPYLQAVSLVSGVEMGLYLSFSGSTISWSGVA
tara:strand:+ start:1682 stop:2155 length:474 start_codon:yes stop_codon:yes gene_type:complete